MKKQKWIWEYDEYPNFKYDKAKLEPLLRDIAYEQGKLKSFMLFMDKESTKYSLAITHLWFVIIHPFDDGNGRITRALTDRVLSKLEQSSFSKIYTMSKSIYED